MKTGVSVDDRMAPTASVESDKSLDVHELVGILDETLDLCTSTLVVTSSGRKGYLYVCSAGRGGVYLVDFSGDTFSVYIRGYQDYGRSFDLAGDMIRCTCSKHTSRISLRSVSRENIKSGYVQSPSKFSDVADSVGVPLQGKLVSVLRAVVVYTYEWVTEVASIWCNRRLG